VAVNYSSENYMMKIPGGAKILLGEKTLKPASIVINMEGIVIK
jgi:beta-galactosidase